jgi:hypothetical protein
MANKSYLTKAHVIDELSARYVSTCNVQGTDSILYQRKVYKTLIDRIFVINRGDGHFLCNMFNELLKYELQEEKDEFFMRFKVLEVQSFRKWCNNRVKV